jgi:hypothetical protein
MSEPRLPKLVACVLNWSAVVRGSQVNCNGIIIHFNAGPEGQRGPVVPCINNACSHMLALRGYFVAIGRLLDADGKLLVRPEWRQLLECTKLRESRDQGYRGGWLTWYAPSSVTKS